LKMLIAEDFLLSEIYFFKHERPACSVLCLTSVFNAYSFDLMAYSLILVV